MSESGLNAAPIAPRFTSASRMHSAASAIRVERSADLSARRDHILEKAVAHFEQHRSTWTEKQYGKLLGREGERMALRPYGATDDRKAHLYRAADHLVRHRHEKRIASIEQAAEKMMGRSARDGR